MNWLPWLILVVVLGMLAYPIIMIVPSARQKQLMALRISATQHGIAVQIRSPILPARLKDHYRQLANGVAYALPCHDSCLTGSYTALRSSHSGDWFWPDQQRPPVTLLPALLAQYQQLPDYCLAVEQGPAGSAVYVREVFPADDIARLHASLTKLNQLICK